MFRAIRIIVITLVVVGVCATSRAADPQQQRIKKLQLAVHNLIVESEYESKLAARQYDATKKFFREFDDGELQNRIQAFIEADKKVMDACRPILAATQLAEQKLDALAKRWNNDDFNKLEKEVADLRKQFDTVQPPSHPSQMSSMIFPLPSAAERRAAALRMDRGPYLSTDGIPEVERRLQGLLNPRWIRNQFGNLVEHHDNQLKPRYERHP